MSRDGDVLYPFRFSPLAKEKVWGGRQIAQRYNRELPTDRLIGETWAVWDQLSVRNGPLKGRRLDELVRTHPFAILGERLSSASPQVFPHLIKLIDTQQKLSVQVHPGDAYAQEREAEPFGKAEVWYILDAEPNAKLIHGVKEPLSRSLVQQAIDAGKLEDLLEYVAVQAGDVIYNPPGTIHAITEGILLYELQQSSDLTYRFYDWDRRDPNRPLQIEKSLDVACLEPFVEHKIQPIEIQEAGAVRTLLCATQYFACELLQIQERQVEQPSGKCFHALTILQGAGSIRYGGDVTGEIPVECGQSFLMPAGIRQYAIVADEPLVVIKAYVPDLLNDIVVPLQERGIPANSIRQLANPARDASLRRYLQ